MAQLIFVNLPVKDLEKSKQFFGQLGYTFNPQFSDETAACMVISEHIYAMLLTYPKFKEFTHKAIVDAHQSTEVMVALSAESKGEIDHLMEKALANGGTETRDTMDYGYMYGRSFQDLDGHIWEYVWMDMSAVPEQG